MSGIVVDRRRRVEEVQRIGQKQRKRKINGLVELLRRVNEEGGEVLLFPRGTISSSSLAQEEAGCITLYFV